MHHSAKYLLFVSLILTAIVSPEYASAIYLLFFLFLRYSLRAKLYGEFRKFLPHFFALFLLGCVFCYRNEPYVIAKDIWYVLKIPLELALGYCLMQKIARLTEYIKYTILAAVFCSIVHLFKISTNLAAGLSFIEMRNIVGSGYLMSAIGLGSVLFAIQLHGRLGLSRQFVLFSSIICATSLILSGSRSNIVSLFLIFLALKGRELLESKYLITAIGLIIGSVLLFSGDFLGSDSTGNSLGEKFANSTTEIAARDYTDMGDINSNWRGYESYRAFGTFMDGGVLEKLIGHGNGATVDLGFEMPLGGDGSVSFRYIPILHNGYMFVLVKFGIIGLIIYFSFIFKFIFVDYKIRHKAIEGLFLGRFIRGIGLSILATTVVISGVFNKFELNSALIFLGGLLMYYFAHFKSLPRIYGAEKIFPR